jgi:hypothetical protein
MTVALAYNNSLGVPAIQPDTLKTVTFSGSKSTIVPNGALVVSDPLQFNAKANSILSISIYLKDGQLTNYVTSHPGSRTTSWFGYGDQTSAANITGPSTGSVAHWFVLSASDITALTKLSGTSYPPLRHGYHLYRGRSLSSEIVSPMVVEVQLMEIIGPFFLTVSPHSHSHRACGPQLA